MILSNNNAPQRTPRPRPLLLQRPVPPGPGVTLGATHVIIAPSEGWAQRATGDAELLGTFKLAPFASGSYLVRRLPTRGAIQRLLATPPSATTQGAVAQRARTARRGKIPSVWVQRRTIDMEPGDPDYVVVAPSLNRAADITFMGTRAFRSWWHPTIFYRGHYLVLRLDGLSELDRLRIASWPDRYLSFRIA